MLQYLNRIAVFKFITRCLSNKLLSEQRVVYLICIETKNGTRKLSKARRQAGESQSSSISKQNLDCSLSLSLSLCCSSSPLARSINTQKHQLSLACADCCLKCFPMNSKCVLCSGFASQNLRNPFRVCVELLWLPQLLGLGTINERKAIRTCRKFNSLLATYPVSTRAIYYHAPTPPSPLCV